MAASHHPPPPDSAFPEIGILERNAKVAQRAARVLRSASGLMTVAAEADPASLRSMIGDGLKLLACDAADLDLALEWADKRYADASVVTWTNSEMGPLLEAARTSSKLVSMVGWPSFASMPRPWELALATRRIIAPNAVAPRLSELFAWGSTVMKFRPRTSDERDVAIAEVTMLTERTGASTRTAQKVGEVAHEMLMNAMYDAPVDADGHQLYAHDRKQAVELDDKSTPTFRFAADGVHVALQIVDPFGRLTRRHVIDGILRARAEQLDTSGGGAGLGLGRIYAASTVMIVDVAPGRYSSVTSWFDLDVNPREARTMPVSLHIFDPASR